MDESNGISVVDLLRALVASVDDRRAFGDDARGFLNDRGLDSATAADVREAVTMSAEELAPAAGVPIDVLTAPAPTAAPVPAGVGPADPLDGAIAEISRLMGVVDPDFALMDPALSALAPEDEAPSPEPAVADAPAARGALDELWGGVEAAGDELGAFSEDTGAAVDEETEEAAEDFAEGDYAAGILGATAGGILAPVANVAETTLEAIGDVAGGAVHAAGSALGSAAEAAADIFVGDENAAAAGDYVEEYFDRIGGGIHDLMDGAGTNVSYAVEGAGEVVEGIGEVIDEGIEAVGDAAEEVGDWLGI